MPLQIPPSKMHHPIPLPSGPKKSQESRRNRRRRENLDITRTSLTEEDIGILDRFLVALRILIETLLVDNPIFVRHLPRFRSYPHRRIFVLKLADEVRLFETVITNEVEIRIIIVIKKWFGIPLTAEEIEMDQDPTARKARVFIARDLSNHKEQPLADKWQMWRDLGAKLPPVPLSNLKIIENNGQEMATSSTSNMDCDMDENIPMSSQMVVSQNTKYDKENDVNMPTTTKKGHIEQEGDMSDNDIMEIISMQNSDSCSTSSLKFLPIIGDGNCGMRTIAHFIYKNEYHYMRVRKELMEYLTKEMASSWVQLFGASSSEVHNFVVQNSKDKAWTSHSVFYVAARLYNVNFKGYSSEKVPGTQWISYSANFNGTLLTPLKPDVPTHIFHFRRDHYEVILT